MVIEVEWWWRAVVVLLVLPSFNESILTKKFRNFFFCSPYCTVRLLVVRISFTVQEITKWQADKKSENTIL